MLSVADISCQLPASIEKERLLSDVGLLDENGIAALRPDILAAVFVVDVLGRKPDLAPEMLWAALACDMAIGTGRLARMSYDAEIVIGLNKHKICDWLVEAVQGNIDRAKLLEPFIVKANLPIGLRTTGIAVCRTLLAAPELSQIERARLENNFSVYLSELGKRQEALGACLRAVEIYERLAESNPEAFGPDLARSHGAMGSAYRVFSEPLQASTSFRNGISTLKPFLLRHPEPFLDLMSFMVKGYLQEQEKISGERDSDLLSEVQAVLSRYQQQE
jgi:hypothetical protein